MGIHGARSLMDSDPTRYGCPWQINSDGSAEEPIILLVDGMSLLYHVTIHLGDTVHASPATVKKRISGYISQLLQALRITNDSGMEQKSQSALHIFMDGLAPRAKIPTQVSRLRHQAVNGDILARGDEQQQPVVDINGNSKDVDDEGTADDAEMTKGSSSSSAKVKVLHLLAEWAMVEAIEDLKRALQSDDDQCNYDVTDMNGSSSHNSSNSNNNNCNQLKKNGRLFLHRASRGEAEAYIDAFIPTLPPQVTCFILADDTDFLVYPNCRGFVTFKSLQISQVNNEVKENPTTTSKHHPPVRLTGFQYLRTKFLQSFLPSGATDDDVLPIVAALAGCDYSLSHDLKEELKQARLVIQHSDVGGLGPVARNQPSRAQILMAILRYVAHHVQHDGNNWVDSLIRAVVAAATKDRNKKPGRDHDDSGTRTDNHVASTEKEQVMGATLMEAFIAIRNMYSRTLAPPSNPEFEARPSSAEIRRLLEYGVFFCRPVIETWKSTSSLSNNEQTSRKRSLDDGVQLFSISHIWENEGLALVISPPFTRQVASWTAQDSVWRMPHFRQVRMRLYCLLAQFARRTSRNDANIQTQQRGLQPRHCFQGGELRLSNVWLQDQPIVTEYVRASRNGMTSQGVRIDGKSVEVPTYDSLSTGWLDEAQLLMFDSDAIDMACAFCILGNVKQSQATLNSSLRGKGALFLATVMLPFNLALLLILMGTSPSLADIDLAAHVEEVACEEVNSVLPCMSVAWYHAILVSNTITSLYGGHSEEQRKSNLANAETSSRGLYVSEIFRHDEALWIWQALRTGVDLEQIKSLDNHDTEEMEFALEYLETAMDKIHAQLPQEPPWEREMTLWRNRAKVLWVIWWEIFTVNQTVDVGRVLEEVVNTDDDSATVDN